MQNYPLNNIPGYEAAPSTISCTQSAQPQTLIANSANPAYSVAVQYMLDPENQINKIRNLPALDRKEFKIEKLKNFIENKPSEAAATAKTVINGFRILGKCFYVACLATLGLTILAIINSAKHSRSYVFEGFAYSAIGTLFAAPLLALGVACRVPSYFFPMKSSFEQADKDAILNLIKWHVVSDLDVVERTLNDCYTPAMSLQISASPQEIENLKQRVKNFKEIQSQLIQDESDWQKLESIMLGKA